MLKRFFPLLFTKAATFTTFTRLFTLLVIVMILIYCPKITNRSRYSMELVFKTILGSEFALTTSEDEYRIFRGARLNYSKTPFDNNEVFIEASGFLEKRGVEKFTPEFSTIKELHCLFPTSNMACNVGFDSFAATFYLVTRFEEYSGFVPDKHGRFKAEESIAFKKGFLHIPVVNRYALVIKELLGKKFATVQFNPSGYSFIPTYDVDVAYAYRGRGVLRNIAALVKDLAKGNLQRIKERLRVLRLLQPDPFDSYDYTLGLDNKLNLRSFYFFLCGDYGPFDRNISPFSNAFVNLVKKIGDYAFCGIHPSYESNSNPEKLSVEKERLTKILNREIRFSRQHFLKFRLPGTYNNLLKQNIDHDFSMGYASQLGFRASIATPFFFYDLEREEATPLKVFPLAVMDTTLFSYLKLDPKEALKRAKSIVDEVKKVNGTFISLWHNETLSGASSSQPLIDCYEQLARYATPNTSGQ